MAILLGTLDNDRIDGTNSSDLITAFAGNDRIFGGGGADTNDAGSGDDIIYAGSLTDWSDGAADSVVAGAGNDHVYAAYGDALSGGTGFDILSIDLRGAANGVNVDFRPMTIGIGIDILNLVSVPIRLGRFDLDGFEAVDAVIGTQFADRIFVGNQDRVATTLDGGAGNDVLLTGNGNDHIDGGSGADIMRGGNGDDTYIVDSRSDRVIEQGNSGSDTVLSSVNFALRDNIETLTLVGSAETGNGNSGHNTLNGSAGGNRLFGMEGRDTLNGGAGADLLDGGAGRDILTGGTGVDTFVFAQGETSDQFRLADTITDFSHAEGDRIRLNQIDAVDGGNDDRFSFVGSAAFSGTAGELRVEQFEGQTFVSGDTNGDATADFFIALTGPVDLVAADFIL